ncbi:MAG: hypothetical protein D3903_13990, partial [Candidatus Electrothrix sp. GM3_4]|nr:hypothetical protein [Candidatus Electrothrix sp. GM3_4]
MPGNKGNDDSMRSAPLSAVAFLRQCLRWGDRNNFLLATLAFLLGIVTAHSHAFVFAESLTRGAVLLLAGSAFA